MDKAIKKFLAYLDKLEEGINKDFISLHFSKRMDKEVKLKELDLKSREVKNFRKYLTELKDYQDALELINKLFPKFIKDTGLEIDNITWYAGLHTNTKTRHMPPLCNKAKTHT